MYADALCLLRVNKELPQEKAEITKVQKSPQSEEIHFGRRALTSRRKYRADRKKVWVESDFKMKMTLVITGGLQLYDPRNLQPT